MKEYRILRGEDAANEDKVNELAQQGFVISVVVTGSERHGMVVYMEKDTFAETLNLAHNEHLRTVAEAIGKAL